MIIHAIVGFLNELTFEYALINKNDYGSIVSELILESLFDFLTDQLIIRQIINRVTVHGSRLMIRVQEKGPRLKAGDAAPSLRHET